MGFYIATLIIYFGTYFLGSLALNVQYGYAGLLNFAFILFESVGAYAAALAVLGPDTGPGQYQEYLFGSHLVFPLPLVVAIVAGTVLSLLVGLFSLRRIRGDYQAAVLLIVSLIALQVVSADTGLVNGSNGLSGVPQPLENVLHLSLGTYTWVFAGWVLALCVGAYFLVNHLCESSWGRALRANRDQSDAAEALGLNSTLLKMEAFALGGALAGLAGGLLVEFLGAWSPGAWGYAETFVIFTAVLVGGAGSNKGMILGALVVPVLVLEAPTFLPSFGPASLVPALQWILIGLLWMAFLGLRPQGLIAERRRVARRPRAAGTAE